MATDELILDSQTFLPMEIVDSFLEGIDFIFGGMAVCRDWRNALNLNEDRVCGEICEGVWKNAVFVGERVSAHTAESYGKVMKLAYSVRNMNYSAVQVLDHGPLRQLNCDAWTKFPSSISMT